jgi:hypothetical protein
MTAPRSIWWLAPGSRRKEPQAAVAMKRLPVQRYARSLAGALVASRRGGRVVEGARLESVYTGNRIEGSNPSPSANQS